MIAKLFAPLAANNPGALGLSDDAATVQVPSDQELVVTKDMLVEGVHFLHDDPPDLLAKKALRVNLSDLAAKGATPRNYLLGLSLAPWIGDEWLTGFAAGLAEDQKRFAVTLSGGDTTASAGPLTISITALGTVPLGRMIRRKGARPRDAVFVTGTIGDAGAGLAVLKGEGVGLSDFNRSALISRYQLPEPRVALGRQLLGIASSALDVSDGLLADLGHIAKISEAKIAIDAAKIPVSAATQALWGQSEETIIRAATSGDDYEIAFTAPASARARVEELSRTSGVAITEIGRVEAGTGAHLLDEKGKPIAVPRAGFTHF
jgi:thiamine-monophosphate kinase